MHLHDSQEWCLAYQKDRGNFLVLIARPQHYAWLADIGGLFLCFANAKHWWRLASLLQAYRIAEWMINKSEHKNREVLTIDLTRDQTHALVDDGWWPWDEEDDDQ